MSASLTPSQFSRAYASVAVATAVVNPSLIKCVLKIYISDLLWAIRDSDVSSGFSALLSSA